MNMKTAQSLHTAALVATCGFAASSAGAAEYLMLNDPSLSTGFEQRWNDPDIWSLQSGVDDGANGIPDGTDTIIINRNTGGFPQNNTDLSNEGMPANHTVAKITGTGAPGRDIVLKTVDASIVDLEVLSSPDSFTIQLERDKSLTISGVISGAGNLVIDRSGGFSDGVTPDEILLITGGSANTITGNFTLNNSNGGGVDSFWVADKVGAFGQAATLTVGGNPAGGVSQLVLSLNTLGGEGAIDDDATSVVLGSTAEFNVALGVNEFIGSGLLTVDGNVIADGIYNNSESWIVGDGLITVGIPEPGSLALLGLGGLMLARRRRG